MKECAQNVYLWLAVNTVIQAFLCVQIHQSGNGRAWSLWDRVEAAPMSREITTLAMLFSCAVKYVNLFVPRVIPCQHCLLKTSNLTPAKTIESSKGNHVLTFVLTGLCSTFMCLPLLPYFCLHFGVGPYSRFDSDIPHTRQLLCKQPPPVWSHWVRVSPWYYLEGVCYFLGQWRTHQLLHRTNRFSFMYLGQILAGVKWQSCMVCIDRRFFLQKLWGGSYLHTLGCRVWPHPGQDKTLSRWQAYHLPLYRNAGAYVPPKFCIWE